MDDHKKAEETKKTFKVCFANKNLPGRSNIQVGKPLQLFHIVTNKFYSNDQRVNEDTIQKYMKMLNNLGCREKQSKAITENQRYGWYQVQLIDFDKADRRLFSHIQTSNLVQDHLMNYTKIRD